MTGSSVMLEELHLTAQAFCCHCIRLHLLQELGNAILLLRALEGEVLLISRQLLTFCLQTGNVVCGLRAGAASACGWVGA